jgi:hypothetical protein
MALKLLGAQSALGVGTGNGSSFANASAVRVVNPSATNYVVSVETSGNVLVGSFTLCAGESEIIYKNTTDEIFATNAAVLGAAVGFSH